MGFEFFAISITLGIALAMDAFSVALANGMNENKMKIGRMCTIAGVFAFFQALMPFIGWACIGIANKISFIEKIIPYIALIILSYIGGKMIYDGIKKDCDCEDCAVGFGALMIQGVATSIDALTAGFTMVDYDIVKALVSVLVIALVTFVICIFGVWAGKKFGNMLSSKATVLGGVILVCIGIYTFAKDVIIPLFENM